METTNRVTFNEEAHSYTANQTGKKYTSATTLISKFKQPFDTWNVARAYAKKNGQTAEYWVNKWKEMGRVACDKGTKFHKRKEDAMRANVALITDEIVRFVQDINAFTEPNINYANLPDGVYPEMLLWNHYFEIAGLADIVTLDGEYFDVDDYKTNKKIDTQSFRHPQTGHKMMKFPLNTLMDCNYIHYCLQLSLYAFMIEQLTGKKCRSICFHHHPPMELDPTQAQDEGIRYEVPYLRDQVLLMLYVATSKDISIFR